jgi:2-polyprenyl-3-methyl-5-hydroxy-6-metoxy-1,4-benzoquinol methylase
LDEEQTPYDEDYYRTGGYADLNTGLTGQYFWARRFYAGLVRRYCASGGRVLEVGCGLGHVLQRLQDQYEAYGIDVSAYAVDQARITAPRAKAEVLGVEEIARYGAGFFDAMIAVHVFEHLEQPSDVARICFEALRPGGVLIMATPNLAAPMKERKGDRWFGYKDPTHISMKVPGEWLTMLKDAGFSIRRTFGDGMWDVPYVPRVPAFMQLPIVGFPAIVQTLSGVPMIPVRFSESLIAVAQKPRARRENA